MWDYFRAVLQPEIFHSIISIDLGIEDPVLSCHTKVIVAMWVGRMVWKEEKELFEEEDAWFYSIHIIAGL